MDNKEITDRIELTELSNKLFMFVDAQQWENVLREVFMEQVWFDMRSAGGEAKELSAIAICELWREGFTGLDAIHHQAGHYVIDVHGDEADIYAYAIATHFKKAATKGRSRVFVGSYDLKAKRTRRGWRLSQFKYNLKYIDGNASLE